jgi:hypothetical protein
VEKLRSGEEERVNRILSGFQLAGVCLQIHRTFGHCSGAVNALATPSFPAPSCPVDMNGPDLVLAITGSQRAFTVDEKPQESLVRGFGLQKP